MKLLHRGSRARRLVTIALLSLLPAPLAHGAPRRTIPHSGIREKCPGYSASHLRVSEDSVGPFSIRATMGELQRLCPTATATVRYGAETVNPALMFLLGRDTVLASQSRDSLLEGWAPDTWVVSGPDVILPMGIPLRSTWQTFRKAYGPARWAPAISLAMMTFCRYPKLALQLNMTFDGEPIQPAAVPDSAMVVALWAPGPRSRRDCV